MIFFINLFFNCPLNFFNDNLLENEYKLLGIKLLAPSVFGRQFSATNDVVETARPNVYKGEGIEHPGIRYTR